MAGSQAELRSIAETFERAEELRRADLVGTERLGHLSFAGTSEIAESILHLLGELRDLPLANLPQKRLSNLTSSAQTAVSAINRMVGFSSSQGSNLQEERNKIIQALNDSYDALFSAAAPVIAYHSSAPELVKELEKRQSETIAAIKESQDVSTEDSTT